jgi:hypothetical protein
MKAQLLFYRKNVEADGVIVEMKIWEVPPAEGAGRQFKYSLVYVKDGKRLVGYDNGEGKGHHKHIRGKQSPYSFINIDRMIDDFYQDLEAVRRDET